MLTALVTESSEAVVAWACGKHQGPFRCKACAKEAILVKGNIRSHHFRHMPVHASCPQEKGETPAHRECKKAIYEALAGCDGVETVELEYRVGKNVADVFAIIRGVPVAIEVQRSSLSVRSITLRTIEYHRNKVFVLWLGLLTESACFNGYSPAAWEKWCHATYGGRVYYWVGEDTVQPIHFGPHKESVPQRTWPGAAGKEFVAGGYDRYSKSLRTPEHGQRIRIAEHFRPVIRAEWKGGSVEVPSCSVFVDRQSPWWKANRGQQAR